MSLHVTRTDLTFREHVQILGPVLISTEKAGGGFGMTIRLNTLGQTYRHAADTDTPCILSFYLINQKFGFGF